MHAGAKHILILAVAAGLALAACGEDADLDPVTAAQRRVTSAQKDVDEAQASFDAASDAFCGESKDYIAAVDRYGKAFNDSAATVGDVRSAGADLEAPRKQVASSAGAVTDAGDGLAEAHQDLADAQVALVEAKSGTSTTAPTGSTTTTAPIVSSSTIDRVEQAESEWSKATSGITDATPLNDASVQLNSAAFALEVAWLRMFDEAGCLDEQQQAKAVGALTDYTTGVQTRLHAAGYFEGPIDGVYGPSTVAAVEQVQDAGDLPVTGYVDRATSDAIDDAAAAKGGEVATDAISQTAALQTLLKLAGYWSGPVDGKWTKELSGALEAAQTALGVPPSGELDAATLAAIEQAAADARTVTTTTTTAAGPATSATTSTTGP